MRWRLGLHHGPPGRAYSPHPDSLAGLWGKGRGNEGVGKRKAKEGDRRGKEIKEGEGDGTQPSLDGN